MLYAQPHCLDVTETIDDAHCDHDRDRDPEADAETSDTEADTDQ